MGYPCLYLNPIKSNGNGNVYYNFKLTSFMSLLVWALSFAITRIENIKFISFHSIVIPINRASSCL